MDALTGLVTRHICRANMKMPATPVGCEVQSHLHHTFLCHKAQATTYYLSIEAKIAKKTMEEVRG